MKAFAELYLRLDGTTSSNAKLLALREYFSQAPAQDAAWAVYFLAGGRPRHGCGENRCDASIPVSPTAEGSTSA